MTPKVRALGSMEALTDAKGVWDKMSKTTDMPAKYKPDDMRPPNRWQTKPLMHFPSPPPSVEMEAMVVIKVAAVTADAGDTDAATDENSAAIKGLRMTGKVNDRALQK